MSKEFFDAVRAGDRVKVETLLAADPALLAARDEKGLDAFTAAKYSQRNEIARLLLDKGIPLDIFAACMAGSTERVIELIEKDREPTRQLQPRRLDAAALGRLLRATPHRGYLAGTRRRREGDREKCHHQHAAARRYRRHATWTLFARWWNTAPT